jgi:hypothetical protein
VRWLFLISIAVAVAAVGCSGDDDADPASADAPLSATELGWLRGYSAWTIAIYDRELGPSGGPRLVEACRERGEELGDAPTERLQPAADHAAGACPFLAERGMQRRALDLVDEADDLIRPYLLKVRPMSLESGLTDESRADVDLSGWVSRELGRPAEVRCWDEEDWKRVVEEDNAWTDSHDDPETLYGWAEYSTDRIHMRLEQCNHVAEFRAGDEGSGSREHELDVADALGTLFHEKEHLVDPDADEAAVECDVLYFFDLYGVRLGGDRNRSEKLARLYRTEVHPEQPEEYQGDCEE